MLTPTAASLPTPNFAYNPQTDLRAAIRPYRNGSYRLEAETISRKFIVHNYGHGGAGITMAPGCAEEVWSIVSASGLAPAGTKVAVLGAGVMGLTAAVLLKSKGLNVSMYACAFSGTTSDVAGGQWSASLVKEGTTTAEIARFHRILRTAFRYYETKIPDNYGVSRRSNYTWHKTAGFSKVPNDLIPPPKYLTRLPFQNHIEDGWKYETLLVETPIYLARLRQQLDAAQVRRVTKCFRSNQDVANLSEPVVINCTGLGSRDIWPDSALQAIRGQLVMLPPQPQLKYLCSGNGYIFPRADAVVIGGSEEYDDTSLTPDPVLCDKMVGVQRKAFGTMRVAARSAAERQIVPSWLEVDRLEPPQQP